MRIQEKLLEVLSKALAACKWVSKGSAVGTKRLTIKVDSRDPKLKSFEACFHPEEMQILPSNGCLLLSVPFAPMEGCECPEGSLEVWRINDPHFPKRMRTCWRFVPSVRRGAFDVSVRFSDEGRAYAAKLSELIKTEKARKGKTKNGA